MVRVMATSIAYWLSLIAGLGRRQSTAAWQRVNADGCRRCHGDGRRRRRTVQRGTDAVADRTARERELETSSQCEWRDSRLTMREYIYMSYSCHAYDMSMNMSAAI